MLHEEPTRKTNHSSSCFDHVFANMHHEVSISKCAISDHYTLLVNTNLELHFVTNTPRNCRVFKNLLNETTACKLLFLLNHRSSKAFENLDTFSLETMARVLVDVCNTFCPEKKLSHGTKLCSLG